MPAASGINGMHATEVRRNRMEKLMSTVNELNRAMESFVVSVVVSEPGDEEDELEEEMPIQNNHSIDNGHYQQQHNVELNGIH
uniref:Uncharacterized protein n=1 Tax=Ditylenchus dipsaci TaxID=166011 RepID=A0A915DTP9_9BILA